MMQSLCKPFYNRCAANSTLLSLDPVVLYHLPDGGLPDCMEIMGRVKNTTQFKLKTAMALQPLHSQLRKKEENK